MRTEEEILKEFENLGYVVIENNETWLELLSEEDGDIRISICKVDRSFICDYYLNMQEHKLLHELFECWGWI